ncbi:MAG: sulfotransferase [Promethearchaeota archaeon]|jgi:hypothetical protein
MTNTDEKSKNQDNQEFPFKGYLAYALTKFFSTFKNLSTLLDRFETLTLRKEIDKLTVDRPIYITGLARAGTTIILEMLNKHPFLASHKYKHLPLPFLPHWFSYFIKISRFFTKPIERVHKDGIFVTRESPEAVEEKFWLHFFNNNHTEEISNIMSGAILHPKFEQFYRNHIRKLLINQNRSRYLAKNNYHITRLEYLHRILPDLKLLLIIRNPVNHIASLIKQTKLFLKLEEKNPLLIDWLNMTGHREFGHLQLCINVGDTTLIRKIRRLWNNRNTYVKGWAYYWSSIYEYVMNLIESNKKLRKSVLIVRYEDLCNLPAITIDKILNHTELSINKFENVKRYYVKHLHKPIYYTPNFSNQELAHISEITKKTASRFGY